jgi:hypothetical protein
LKEKENFDDSRKCDACGRRCIYFSLHRKRRFLFLTVFLSAQLYLYRSFYRMGAFRPSSHSSETGNFENREAPVATAIENKLMVTTLKDE